MENVEEVLFWLESNKQVPNEGSVDVRILATAGQTSGVAASVPQCQGPTLRGCSQCFPTAGGQVEVCTCHEEGIPLGEMTVRLDLGVQNGKECKELVMGNAKGEFRTHQEIDESVNIRLNLLVRPEPICE
jgi:hypothetical protein